MNSWYPRPTKPRQVEGGLMARSKRGAIAQTWWSERFIAVLEGLGVGGRLQRGRSYARRGQVINLEIDAGLVSAQVQGSRSRPYRVRIGLTAFGKSGWSRIERELAGNAWYLAGLLAGEMPADIENVFAGTGLPLFPADAGELSMDCSCPDWEVPCKHLAATFYLLAESFDDDPFRILAWRGREREDLLANLQAVRSDGLTGADASEHGSPTLDAHLDSFFAAQAELPLRGVYRTSSTSVIDRLPPLSGVAGSVRGRPLPELLRLAYAELAGARTD